MDRRDDGGRDQPAVGERQEVESVVDDVELRRPFEDLGDVEALGHLRIEGRVLRPPVRHHGTQAGRGQRITGGEQRDVVPARHQSLRQEGGEELPRPIVAGRHPPRERSQDRDAQRLQRPRPVRLSFLSCLASRFSLRDLPGFFPAGFCGDFSGMSLSFVRGVVVVGSRAASSAASGTVATPIAESPMPYGRTRLPPCSRAPQEYTTLGTYPFCSSAAGLRSGRCSCPRIGSALRGRAAGRRCCRCAWARRRA